MWYAHDSGLVSTFEIIKAWFEGIGIIGPSMGYQPEPSERVFVPYKGSTELAISLFSEEGIKINTSLWYFDGYLGVLDDSKE